MAKLLILQVVHYWLLLRVVLFQVLHTRVCDADDPTTMSNNHKTTIMSNIPKSKCTSSCGKLTKIRYPFRLNTDPINCGQKHYEISCENNIPVLYTPSHQKYYVRSINYDTSSIRLSDASLISLTTNHSLFCGRSPTRYLVPHSENKIYKYVWLPFHEGLVIINCPSPMPNPNHDSYYHLVDAPPCNNTNYDSFSSDHNKYMDSCRVELNFLTSFSFSPPTASGTNISYKDVYNSLAYGFDLSWDFSPVPWGNNLLFKLAFLVLCYYSVIFLLGTPCIALFLSYKWRQRYLSMFKNIEEFLHGFDQSMPIRYSYADIKKMTKGLKEKLGEGGYGCVYKAKLRSGQLAAVKMLGKVETDGKEFINEVATIGRIHHHNIVQLIGFCAEKSKRALVYEYMPNGSLDRYIKSREEEYGCIPTISNKKLYEISLGVARGIEYVHRGCDMQILHFDLKPHNILLDKNFTPKISDFGLAKLCPTNKNIVSLTTVKGTIGYMALELIYKSVGDISYKADVYSFGRMLMEIAGRKRDLNTSLEHSSQIFLPSWVPDQLNEGKDIYLGDNSDEDKEITKRMVLVGLWCVQLNPNDRPSMHKVVQMLEGGVESQQLPQKPLLAPQVTMFAEDSSATMTNTSHPISTMFIGDSSATMTKTSHPILSTQVKINSINNSISS